MPSRPGAGRKRNDSLVRRLDGSAKPRPEVRENDVERDIVIAPPGVPIPPADMPQPAMAVWSYYAPLLAQVDELMSLLDLSVLEDFCMVVAQHKSLEAAQQAEIDLIDPAVKGKHRTIAIGGIIKSYALELNRIRQREGVLRTQLGLSPIARSSMKVGPMKLRSGDEAAKADQFEEMFDSTAGLMRV